MKIVVLIGFTFFLLGCSQAELKKFSTEFKQGHDAFYDGQAAYHANNSYSTNGVSGMLRGQVRTGTTTQCSYNTVNGIMVKSVSGADMCPLNTTF
tara:strand:- start:229 stop:513 length:285 start_codon:yes stop_codon:yes gene_type:complete